MYVLGRSSSVKTLLLLCTCILVNMHSFELLSHFIYLFIIISKCHFDNDSYF